MYCRDKYFVANKTNPTILDTSGRKRETASVPTLEIRLSPLIVGLLQKKKSNFK